VAEEKTVAQNRRARHEYSIEDSFEAGIVLTGTEIKSVRVGKVSLAEAYARIEGGEAWLIGATIQPWTPATATTTSPRGAQAVASPRPDRRPAAQDQGKGLTLVPLKMYITTRGRAKLEIGLGRGKQQHDRRHDIADRDSAGRWTGPSPTRSAAAIEAGRAKRVGGTRQRPATAFELTAAAPAVQSAGAGSAPLRRITGARYAALWGCVVSTGAGYRRTRAEVGLQAS